MHQSHQAIATPVRETKRGVAEISVAGDDQMITVICMDDADEATRQAAAAAVASTPALSALMDADDDPTSFVPFKMMLDRMFKSGSAAEQIQAFSQLADQPSTAILALRSWVLYLATTSDAHTQAVFKLSPIALFMALWTLGLSEACLPNARAHFKLAEADVPEQAIVRGLKFALQTLKRSLAAKATAIWHTLAAAPALTEALRMASRKLSERLVSNQPQKEAHQEDDEDDPDADANDKDKAIKRQKLDALPIHDPAPDKRKAEQPAAASAEPQAAIETQPRASPVAAEPTATVPQPPIISAVDWPPLMPAVRKAYATSLEASVPYISFINSVRVLDAASSGFFADIAKLLHTLPVYNLSAPALATFTISAQGASFKLAVAQLDETKLTIMRLH